jgi:quercetin dioxygenase-like cupin family protein
MMLERAAEQPYGIEIHIADDVFVKQSVVAKAGTILPQHAHRYDHLSMIAVGSVRVWEDGRLKGEFKAPTGVHIRAGVKHTFQTLEDGTVIYCVHNAAHAEVAEIVEEHHLVGDR